MAEDNAMERRYGFVVGVCAGLAVVIVIALIWGLL